MTLNEKKRLYSKLKELQKVADEIWVPLDSALNKSKILDRIAIITSAVAANAGLMADVFEDEVMADENRWRMEQEFKRIYESEINRLKPPTAAPPTREDSDNEEAGGIPPGA